MTTFAVITAVALGAPVAGQPHVLASTHVGSVRVGTVTAEAVGAASVSGLGAELAYGTVQAKLDSWTRLPLDWDGDDGVPLDATVAQNAINLLSLFRSNDLPCPKPYIAGDGEAGLRWETERGFASVSFLPDRHVVAFVRPESGKPFGLDEQYSELLPIADMIERIREVA